MDADKNPDKNPDNAADAAGGRPSDKDKAASDAEEVMFEGRLPMRAFLGLHGLIYLLVLGWNVGLLVAYLRSLSWRVRLTSQRLVITRGVVAQREQDIPLYRAIDCNYAQTIAGRLLGTGEITLISDDATSPRIAMPFPQPRRHKEMIRDFTIKERRRLRTIDLA